ERHVGSLSGSVERVGAAVNDMSKHNPDEQSANPKCDRAQIWNHVGMLHDAAASARKRGFNGTLRVFVRNNDDTIAKNLEFEISHYKDKRPADVVMSNPDDDGKIDDMVDAILEWASKPGMHVSMPWAIFKRGGRRTEDDVIAVLAAVLDDDKN